MLLRDLLVALPGLIAPTGSSSRVEEIEVQKSPQIVSPLAATEAKAVVVPGLAGSSSFLDKAMQDFYQQTGTKPPVETPPVQEPDQGPAPSTPLPARVDSLTAEAGRVLTIEPEGGNIASVRVLSQASHGHVSVNPDNSL